MEKVATIRLYYKRYAGCQTCSTGREREERVRFRSLGATTDQYVSTIGHKSTTPTSYWLPPLRALDLYFSCSLQGEWSLPDRVGLPVMPLVAIAAFETALGLAAQLIRQRLQRANS